MSLLIVPILQKAHKICLKFIPFNIQSTHLSFWRYPEGKILSFFLSRFYKRFVKGTSFKHSRLRKLCLPRHCSLPFSNSVCYIFFIKQLLQIEDN